MNISTTDKYLETLIIISGMITFLPFMTVIAYIAEILIKLIKFM